MSVSVQHGEPAGIILLHANSSNSQVPDLIVVGTHGRRGIDRLRFGSVAERVMHWAPCPTLVVRTSEPSPPAAAHERPFDRILCAVDFSPASLSGLEHAIRMLRDGGSELRLLHIVSVSKLSMPRLACQFSSADYTQELARDAWRRLRALAPLSPNVHLHVSVGVVGDEIARAAADMNADVVVLGVGPAGIVPRLFGSTTARVLRTAMSPVLAVPAVKAVQIQRDGEQLVGRLRPAA